MKHRFILFLISVLFLTINYSFAEGFPKPWVNRAVHQFMQKNAVAGVAVDIYYQGQSYILTYGKLVKNDDARVNQNTIFELGSVTKTFAATLLAMSVQSNRLTLKEQIGAFLPEGLKNANLPIDKVTFLQLATHTASLPDDPTNFRPAALYSIHDFLSFLKNWTPAYPVGSKYSYSNSGFGVLGIALGNVYDEPYAKLQKEKLLEPLKMNSTTLQVDETNQYRYAQGYRKNGMKAKRWPMEPWKPSAGALRSTPADMMKYLKANLGVGDAPADIKRAMQLTHEGFFKVNKNMTQGLAFANLKLRNGKVGIMKDGSTSGFSAFIAMNEPNKIGVVVLASKSGAHVARLSRFLLTRLMRTAQ